MQSKFFDTISKYNMLNKTDDVVIAISGGSDSVCLLLLMIDFYGDDYKNHISCAHYNHMIRGAQSDNDEALVRNLCADKGVRFVVERGDVPRIAADEGLGLEECARKMRYDFLYRVSDKYGKLKIAVAHNKNDNVETIIGNIARGTSINGLKGISYCRGNIIRPLMDYSKEEINLICKQAGVVVADDITNRDNTYKRNKIRNVVLPFLRENLSEQIDDKILSLSESAGIDNSFIEEEARKSFYKSTEQATDRSSVTLNIDMLDSFHSAIKHRIIRMCLASLEHNGITVFPEYVNIDKKTVSRILSGLQSGQTGKTYEALSGVICTVEYNKAIFKIKSSIEPSHDSSIKFEIKSFTADEKKKIISEKNPMTEYFDYDKLKLQYGNSFSFEYRTIKEGDIFHPFGAKGSKLLRKYYIDSKIPQSVREKQKNVCIDNHVIWLPEIRRSDVAKIDESTLNVLILSVF